MRTERFQQVAWMVLLGLIVSGLVWHTPAFAQTKVQRMTACTADEQKFCPDAKTPRARMQCLKSHEAELSQACTELRMKASSAGKQAQAKAVAMKDACKSDFEALCQDVKAGRVAMAKCLKAHTAELSPACKETLPKGKVKAS